MPNIDHPPLASPGARRGSGATRSACPFCTPPDLRVLRKELAEIYTRDLLMPSMHRRAVRLIQRLARATGVTEDEIIARAIREAARIRPETEAVT